MKTYNPTKLSYPIFIQPKLNGVFATLSPDGWLRSKTGQYFPAVQHLFKGLHPRYPLRGELYIHGWPLQDILSAVSPDVPNDRSNHIRFHCYDVTMDEPQFRRRLYIFPGQLDLPINHPSIDYVPTMRIENSKEADLFYNSCLRMRYEGVIYRDWNGMIDDPSAITKRKPFHDEEYLCVNVIEGKGKRKGHVGKFVLRHPNGSTFNCGGGQLSYNELAAFLINPPIGQYITVRYSYKSTADIPQSCQFIRVRNNPAL